MLNTTSLSIHAQLLATIFIIFIILLVRLGFYTILNGMLANHNATMASMTRTNLILDGLGHQVVSHSLLLMIMLTRGCLLVLMHKDFVSYSIWIFFTELWTFIWCMIVQLRDPSLFLILLNWALLRNFLAIWVIIVLLFLFLVCFLIPLIILDTTISHHALVMISAVHDLLEVILGVRLLVLAIGE